MPCSLGEFILNGSLDGSVVDRPVKFGYGYGPDLVMKCFWFLKENDHQPSAKYKSTLKAIKKEEMKTNK